MIGDPLLRVQRPIKLPGGPTNNPAHHTAWTLLMLVLTGLVGWPVFSWLTRDAMPLCIDLPVGVYYPRLDYEDDTWYLDGQVIGHSVVEDAECITPA
jgi:hypothetical protein